MNTRTSHIFRLALMLTGIVVIMLPSCGKRYDSNHAGKYAGREVCAVCEEITQEEFDIALAGKAKYNIYPVQKKLTDKAYQNARKQIDALLKKAQKDSIDLAGSYINKFLYGGLEEEEDTAPLVSYYPDHKDYLVLMQIGCIWRGAALFNEKGKLVPTIISAAQYVSRSTDDVFAGFPEFDCDFHAEIHFFEKGDGHLRKLCIYKAYSWLPDEGITDENTMFWYEDDLYCSGYTIGDYWKGRNEFHENWYATNPPPYDDSEYELLCTNYMKDLQRYYRIRLISPEEKAQIDQNINTIYSRAGQELEIYDDPRWDMFLRGDLQPNVCAFICNIALISDGWLSEVFGSHLYKILQADVENNNKLKQYISTLPEEEQQRVLENALGCMSLDLWENKENGRMYQNYDTLVRDFPMFNNPHSRQTFNEMVNGSFWETYPY